MNYPEGHPIETQDVVVLLAKAFTAVREAKEDDGKIGTMEAVGLGASITPDIIRAVKGFSAIPHELRFLGENELDALYNDFLVRIQWQPDEKTRGIFEICYRVARSIIIGAVDLNNHLNPPKAIPV